MIDFSIPYAAVASVVAGPPADTVRGFGDLGGRRIAVTRGTTNDQELTRGAPRNAEIVRFEDDATSITAVASGQVDYFATAPALIDQVNQRRTARPLEVKFTMRNFPYGVGLRQNEPGLRGWLDGWVRTNVANGKLEEIFRRFHGLSLPPEVLEAARAA